MACLGADNNWFQSAQVEYTPCLSAAAITVDHIRRPTPSSFDVWKFIDLLPDELSALGWLSTDLGSGHWLEKAGTNGVSGVFLYDIPVRSFFSTRSDQKYHKSAELNRRNRTSRRDSVHDIKLLNWSADNVAVKFHCLSCSVCLLSVLWIFFHTDWICSDFHPWTR